MEVEQFFDRINHIVDQFNWIPCGWVACFNQLDQLIHH